MTKPGDRQASPTSCIASPSLPPSAGRAVAAPEPARVFLDRSSLRGRCRVVGISGDPGSFFTIILNPELFETFRRALGGEDFCSCVGLWLDERWVGETLVAMVCGCAVRGTKGDDAAAGGKVLAGAPVAGVNSAYADRS